MVPERDGGSQYPGDASATSVWPASFILNRAEKQI